MKKYAALYVIAAAFVVGSCATKPIIEKPQFTYQHYKQLVLLDPAKPATSPEYEIAVSILQMEYPAEQAQYVHEVLYNGLGMEEYKEDVVQRQREMYRDAVFAEGHAAGKRAEAYNWYYSDTVDVNRFYSPGLIMQSSDAPSIAVSPPSGIVFERTVQTSTGGPVHQNKQFINIDLETLKVVKLTDFFVDFQEETRLRDMIYDELRKLSKLQRGQPLSQGIYFSDNPELSFKFFIADDGLGFHWDPEQIAPLSYGNIQIILPWQIVRPLMLYTGIELLTKFNIYMFM